MKLFEPGRIGGLVLKNRIVMASMNTSGTIETDGTLSQRGRDYYVARAKGGVGLIILGASRVSRELEYVPRAHRVLFVDGSTHVGWLSELTDAVHDYRAKIAVQLQPGRGRIATRNVVRGGAAVAPSPLPCFFDSTVTARELTREEIEHLVQSFEVGAETVKAAGVDAIELNFHAGYLGDEFMTALWNRRTDRYGGNLERRLRFPLEIIAATRRGAGADFPIIFKFGLSHHLEGGRKVTEGLEIARRLEGAGVDALTIDAGCYETQYWTFPAAYQPRGCMVDLAEMVKKAVEIPVIALGKLGYSDLAEQVLRDEKADFIALGRTLLADPDWPKKVREGKLEDIRPCIGDFEGCSRRAIEQKYVSCTVNPATGIEREFTIGLAKEKKSVLVVGGGPGGMEATIVARLRGHEVTLWEKGDTLGGNLIPASVPDFKQDYRRLVDYLAVQVRKLGVNVQLNTEATPDLIDQLNPQVLIVATGSTPMMPEIPDEERGTIFTAPDVLLGKGEVGDSVVVLGGGLVGCETALYLKQQGKGVTIVEVLDEVMGDVFPANRMCLLQLLADVQILTSTKVLRMTDKGLAVANKDGEERILRAETVVVAIGFQSNRNLLESLDGKQLESYAIGDCVEPRKLINAMWEGFRTARLI